TTATRSPPCSATLTATSPPSSSATRGGRTTPAATPTSPSPRRSWPPASSGSPGATAGNPQWSLNAATGGPAPPVSFGLRAGGTIEYLHRLTTDGGTHADRPEKASEEAGTPLRPAEREAAYPGLRGQRRPAQPAQRRRPVSRAALLDR